MNCSCLIPALAGGLLALLTFQRIEDQRAVKPANAVLVPAVVRTLQPQNGAPAANFAKLDGWSSFESLLDQNPRDFRELTSTEIETCALALEGMKRRADRGALGSRSYLHTRLQALREHVDYARNELISLPSSQGDENFIPAHAHFYRTMKSLEQAFAQATNELNGDI